jgi:hypothetical protein
MNKLIKFIIIHRFYLGVKIDLSQNQNSNKEIFITMNPIKDSNEIRSINYLDQTKSLEYNKTFFKLTSIFYWTYIGLMGLTVFFTEISAINPTILDCLIDIINIFLGAIIKGNTNIKRFLSIVIYIGLNIIIMAYIIYKYKEYFKGLCKHLYKKYYIIIPLIFGLINIFLMGWKDNTLRFEFYKDKNQIFTLFFLTFRILIIVHFCFKIKYNKLIIPIIFFIINLLLIFEKNYSNAIIFEIIDTDSALSFFIFLILGIINLVYYIKFQIEYNKSIKELNDINTNQQPLKS